MANINKSILNKGNFRLLIDRVPNVEYYVKSVTLPGFRFTEATASTGIGIDAFFPGDKVEFDTLSVTFLVDEDLKNFEEIYDWMDSVVPFKDPKAYQTQNLQLYSDATLVTTTNKNTPNRYFRFKDCIPTQMGSIDFDTGAELEAITTTVEFRFTYYEII